MPIQLDLWQVIWSIFAAGLMDVASGRPTGKSANMLSSPSGENIPLRSSGKSKL